MKREISTLFFLLMVLTTFGQINMMDSTVQVISYWDKGEKQSYSIVHKKIKTIDSDTTTNEVTIYDVDITVLDSTADTYTVEWVYKNFQNNSQNAITQKLMDVIKDMKVIIKISNLGELLEVVNWKDIRNYIKEATTNLKKDYGNNPEMRGMIDDIEGTFSTKDAIESASIKDIHQFHSFHGAIYPLGEVFELAIKVPNIIGTEPFDADFSVYLDEIDEEQGNFILSSLQVINEEQLMNATFDFLLTMAKNMNQELPQRGDLKELKNETLLTSRIHETGWVLNSILTTTIISGNVKQIEERTIELNY